MCLCVCGFGCNCVRCVCDCVMWGGVCECNSVGKSGCVGVAVLIDSITVCPCGWGVCHCVGVCG